MDAINLFKDLKNKLARFKAGFLIISSLGIFFIFKIQNLTFHFGDGNAYIYMADILWKGLLPYRDYFLADPPFLVILISFFKKVFFNNLLLFQFIPIFFEMASAVIIYLILKKMKVFLAFLGPIFYLLSFSVIATADYLTGVQVVVFFVLLAILFWLKNKFFLSGLFWSLAILTKLYAMAGFLGFLIFLLIKKENNRKIGKLFLGIFLGGFIVLGPFLLFNFKNVWQYLVVHQLNRPEGISKFNIFNFYFRREWLFIIGAFLGGIVSRKKIIILPTLAFIVFFLLFKDLYYLYLNSFFPLLIILTVIFINHIFIKNKIIGKLIIVAYAIFVLFSLAFYNQDFSEKGEFKNLKEISDYISDLPEKYDLYGSHEVVPLVALKTNRRIFENYIDTNGQAFASGGQNVKRASQSVCQKGAYFIAKVTDIPERNIEDYGLDAYFDKEIFKKCCKVIKKFPDISGNQFTKIAIYKCSPTNGTP